MKERTSPRRLLKAALLGLALFAAGCADAFAPREAVAPADNPGRSAIADEPDPKAGREADDAAEQWQAIRERIAAMADGPVTLTGPARTRYPLVDLEDPRHGEVVDAFERAIDRGEELRITSIEDGLAAAFVGNPSLQAADQRVRALRNRFDQILRLDTTVRTTAALGRTLRLRAGPAFARGMTSALHPSPGILDLSGRAVEFELQAAALERDAVARALAADVVKAFADLDALIRTEAIVRSLVAQWKAFEDVVRLRVEGGAAGQGELLQVQNRLSALETRLDNLGDRNRSVEAELAALVGSALHVEMDAAGGHAFPRIPDELDGMLQRARTERPEIRRLRVVLKRMDVLMELAESMSSPGPSPGFSYFERDLAQREGSVRQAGTFPERAMVSRKTDLGPVLAHVDEVRELRAVRERELQALVLDTVSEGRQAHAGLASAWRRERLLAGPYVDRAMSAFESMTAAYKVGRAGYAEVARAWSAVLEARIDREEARRRAWHAWAALVRIAAVSDLVRPVRAGDGK